MAAQVQLEADVATQSRGRKPFKIRGSRGRFKGVVASSLSELKSKACEKLELRQLDDVRVYLHEDGTEVDDEEYFQFLPMQSKLVVYARSNRYDAESDEDMSTLERSESQIVNAQDMTDAGGLLEPKLKTKITKDSTFFVSLSDEELEKVISLDPERATKELNKSKEEIMVYQESCEHELSRRSELRDATELLKLYKRAISRDENL